MDSPLAPTGEDRFSLPIWQELARFYGLLGSLTWVLLPVFPWTVRGLSVDCPWTVNGIISRSSGSMYLYTQALWVESKVFSIRVPVKMAVEGFVGQGRFRGFVGQGRFGSYSNDGFQRLWRALAS